MAKSIVSKDKSSMYPPMKGYMLQEEQMKTIRDVCRALIDAECFLEQDSTDNTMEHYGDFKTLYTDIHKALDQAYHIMRVHNTTEQAYYHAKTEAGSAYGMAIEHSKHVKELMKNQFGNNSGSTQGIIN